MSKDDSLVTISKLTLVGALALSLLYVFAPTVFGIQMLLASLCLIAIAVASFSFHVARASSFFGVSLLILPFAVILSLPLSIGVESESWRLVIFLEHNPQYHVSIVRNTFLFGILPLAIIVAFYAFAWRRKTIPERRLIRVFLVVLGVFSIVWGGLHLQSTMRGYALALSEITAQELGYLSNSLRYIYMYHGLYSTLWILLGILLSASSAHMLYPQTGMREA